MFTLLGRSASGKLNLDTEPQGSLFRVAHLNRHPTDHRALQRPVVLFYATWGRKSIAPFKNPTALAREGSKVGGYERCF